MILAERVGFPCESGQNKGRETLSVEAMKLQILDKIILLTLPNSFETCNYFPELHVHAKYTYLQNKEQHFPL